MKIVKIVGLLIGAVVLLGGGFLGFVAFSGPRHPGPGHLDMKVEVTPARVERGRKFAQMVCAGCHRDPSTGLLTGKALSDVPPEFGKLYSKNITQDPEKGIATWTDGELVWFLRTGINRKGDYVPPYMIKLPHFSDEDVSSIVAFLRSDDPMVKAAHVDPPGVNVPNLLVKFLSRTVFAPLPYPKAPIQTPPESDKVAYGKYLVEATGCYTCHSADFKTMNELEPEKSEGFMGGGNPLLDMEGHVVPSANITMDEETGIGKWTEADFVRAVRLGFRPDNRLVHYPMEPRPQLTESDAQAIWAWLQTVPKLHHAVQRWQPPASSGDAGSVAYHRYGCVGCHNENGVGLGDVRRAAVDFPDDASLTAWIRDAPSIRPGTTMPRWNGIIQEPDYPALVAYVRKLGGTPAVATGASGG